MPLDIVALAAGLLILGKAADAFVVGAGRISLALNVSPVVVGAVVIGFGTSAPELLVSGLAAAQGSLGIAVGNVVGSNIANLTLVAGIAALVSPLLVSSTTLRREAPISLLAVLAFAVVIQGGMGAVEGVLLLAGLAAALAVLVRAGLGEGDPLGAQAETRCAPEEDVEVAREWVRTGLGLLGVLVAAQLIVSGAKGIAVEMGLSEGFVGLTIVAVGTSLPEIVTAVQAARRGEPDLIAGNLFGSNIFNSLGIGGVVALVGPGELDDEGLQIVAATGMMAAAVAAVILLGTRRRLVRWEAGVLLAAYLALLPLL